MAPYESPLQKALREKREAALATTANANGVESAKPFDYGTPEAAKDKIAIIFDDSGSMAGQAIDDAREGCVEFMRNCVPKETACAVYPLNQKYIPITTKLTELSVMIGAIRSTGSTPLFQTLKHAQSAKIEFTRFIIFSDGQPDTQAPKEEFILEMIEKKIPVDTVLISYYDLETAKDTPAYQLLKEIADRTGGYFLVFQRGKVNFKTAFKYLAPPLRLMLADDNKRQQLQEGVLK